MRREKPFYEFMRETKELVLSFGGKRFSQKKREKGEIGKKRKVCALDEKVLRRKRENSSH